MGMGKSLSLISLLLRTLEDGHNWAEKRREEKYSAGRLQKHTHSTLVIVPSACEYHAEIVFVTPIMSSF